MNVQFGPNSIDEPNLLYKLQKKVKVFNTDDQLTNRGYNLVTSASKYGIVFIASPDKTLSVYYLKQLINEESDVPHLSVKLQEKPTHIAVSCDSELLAVTGGQFLCIYKITDFQKQNAAPSVTIKCDVNPSTFVSALQWNPCIPDSIAIAYYDGILIISQVGSGQVKKIQSKARCICWSPKGKQLVTGNSDGTLTQFKPDLTPAKSIPAPNLFEGNPIEALAIYWISTFQFAVVYKNAADNKRPAVTLLNTPKGGQPSCLNYEDICYSMDSNRPWFYYLYGVPQWNIILTSSSNSMEIATLGSADGSNWLQWCQSDEARPELPLIDKKKENYPVGIWIDTCAIQQLPWGEAQTLPYMPMLLVVSNLGQLTIFNVINLNKEAPQICSPPQQLELPANSMTSSIPGEIAQPPQPAATLPTVQTNTQQPQDNLPVLPPYQPKPAQANTLVNEFGSVPGAAKPFILQQPQINQSFSTAPPQLVPIAKPIETKPVTTEQAQPTQTQTQPKTPTPAPIPQAQTPVQAQEANAALKAEQERTNKLKANQELKNMLIKEVNEFQNELYNFLLKTREAQNKLQQNIQSIRVNHLNSIDTEQLRKECSLEELRAVIIQLKLELVRACAVVAEARTHAETKDLQEWTQADPLTTRRVASIKKLSYYIENQLDQAQKALDHKWNDMVKNDPKYNKPGQYMTRPLLDDIYQPLVRQQEILSRQQAVLRVLKNTLNECSSSPIFKTKSLLRSTPFKNRDPLSHLTKNILNMSIEPQNKTKEKLSPQKLDALRDILANNKTAKIKPVNIELAHHINAMKLNYHKAMKEKAEAQALIQEKIAHQKQTLTEIIQPTQIKIEIKPEPVNKTQAQTLPPFRLPSTFIPQMSTPQPFSHSFANQAQSQPAQVQANQAIKSEPQLTTQNLKSTPITVKPNSTVSKIDSQVFAQPLTTASANTRSVLKDLLQNKSQSNIEAKSDANTFMGQKICSPSAFDLSKSPLQKGTASPSFTAKPIAEISNMINKLPTGTSITEIKTSSPKEKETPKEAVMVESKDNKPKQMTNLFGMKSSTPIAPKIQNVPDVLKGASPAPVEKENKNSDESQTTSKESTPEQTIKPISRETKQENKENSTAENKITTEQSVSKTVLGNANQSISISSTTIATVPGISLIEKQSEPKQHDTKEIKATEQPASTASSLFAAANAANASTLKPASIFGSPQSPPATTQVSNFSFASAESKTPQLTSAVTDLTSTVATTGSTFTTTTTSDSTGLDSMSSIKAPVSETKTDVKPSIFSTPIPASSTIFAATTTQSPIFSSSPASIFASANTQAPAFGGSPTAPTNNQSIFSTGTTTTQSVFATPSTPKAVFGSTTTTPVFENPTTTQSVFGTSTSTTQPSVFGGPTTTQSVFGTSTSTTQPSVFGGPTAQTSIFGATTNQPSVFASPTTTVQGSLFNTPAAQTPVFGTTAQPTQSIFGSTTPTTQASIFGQQTTQASSVFGSPIATTQSSVFGSPSQTSAFGSSSPAASGGSLFDTGESNLFAAASISTTSASSPATPGNIFGGSSTGSAFGSANTNIFGASSTFGQTNPSAASIFGGAASVTPKSTNNVFNWGNTTASSGGFGSPGFGQQTTQASSIFGGTTGGSFSTPAPAQSFGSPQQSSAFGSPQQAQAAPAFGGSPVFGSKPVFGQSTGFGSPPGAGTGFGAFSGGFNKNPSSGFGAPAKFGGGAAFGAPAFGNTSPGKVFGGSPTQSFSPPTQSNPTFESLAKQDTLTFGNLAQQTAQAPAAPAFNTSPAFTGWRG